MPVKTIIKTRPSPYSGEEGEPRLQGLQIGLNVLSSDVFGESIVVKREGLPDGVYIRETPEGVDVYVVPVDRLNFGYGCGHSNSSLVDPFSGTPYHQRKLPQLSPTTVQTLEDVIYLGNPFAFLGNPSIPAGLTRFDPQEDSILSALDDVFEQVGKYGQEVREFKKYAQVTTLQVQESPKPSRGGIMATAQSLYRKLFSR